MRLRVIFSIVLGVAVAMLGTPRDAGAEQAKPALSIVAARKVALARVAGTIVNEKLKKKTKKHPLMWSIKIRPRHDAADSDRLTKVEIDANSGSILKVKSVKARQPTDD